MFRHFKTLAITLSDLHEKYDGQTGLWQAFAPPRRDEIGYQAPLGYYEGRFEDVLHAVVLEHRRSFLDESMCGEIIPIVPQRVPSREPALASRPKASVLSLLERALTALDAVPTEAARSEAADITMAVGALQSAILAEVDILKACSDVPVPVLVTLLQHPSPEVQAWAVHVIDARTWAASGESLEHGARRP